MPIELREIKEEVMRIDRHLSNQHLRDGDKTLLLIGGLAVNQYRPMRESKDIDLVCGHKDVLTILRTLYGDSSKYDIVDENNNEYRPNLRITCRRDAPEFVIKFGPKLLERAPYHGINWDEIKTNSRPFRIDNTECRCIRVPSPTHLAYTKALSFVSRPPTRTDKLRQDLADFVDLTNDKSFSVYEFKDLLTRAEAAVGSSPIRPSFLSRVRMLDLLPTFVQSSIAQIAESLLGSSFLPLATITESRYRTYLQVSNEAPVIVAHCRGEKFSRDGVKPPGYELMNMIEGDARVEDLRDNPLGDGRFDSGQYDAGGINWQDHDPNALFLVDSPEYNDYARYVVGNYRRQMVGGHLDLDFKERKNGRLVQKILLDGSPKVTDKSDHPESHSQFGPHEDYLLMMRLPADVLRESELIPTTVLDNVSVVWVLYGITGKGSWAGVRLLEFQNLRRLEQSLREQRRASFLPEHFEVLFRLEKGSGRIASLEDGGLKLIHFSHLTLRRKLVLGDEPPLPLMITNRHLPPPLTSVHLDPMAFCNFRCPKCIEKDLKGQNMALTTRQVLRIISDIHALGCRELSFYGGEPTLHPDFDLFVRIAHAMGFYMVVVTNGSRLGEKKVAQALVDARSSIHLRVSLDANSQATFETAHGLDPGEFDFDGIRQNVKALIAQGVSVGISYLLSTASLGELKSACEEWHKAKAVSFHPRLYMGPHGQLPQDHGAEFVYSRFLTERDSARTTLKAMRKEFGDGWFVMLPWLRSWADEEKPPVGLFSKTSFSHCYSAKYRVAISPTRADVPRNDEADSQASSAGPDYTDSARISFCLYHRDEPAFRDDYPENLPETWATLVERNAIDRPKMESHCRNIVCSRFDSNQQVHDALKGACPDAVPGSG